MTTPSGETRRIVVKIGTQVLTHDADMMDDAITGDVSKNRLQQLVQQLATLVAQGHEVLLVSSGAVGMGRQLLQLPQPLSLVDKQACAAVGQNRLMNLYQQCFAEAGVKIAQVLLTAYDLSDRQRYLNLRETLERLLELKVVPIINENDCVSIAELREITRNKSFGDNDMLSALVASKLEAQQLIILTNVDGIYSDNPFANPGAEKVPLIDRYEMLQAIGVSGGSSEGRGGMATKLRAAQLASLSGVTTIIGSGYRPDSILKMVNGDEGEGTVIMPRNRLSGKKRWIGFASGYEGVVQVNSGARNALVTKNASLLPSGVVGVAGDFAAGDVVSIQDEAGAEVGRGVVNFSAVDIRKIQGCQSKEIVERLGPVTNDVVVQRDNLVIFEEGLV